MAIDVNIRQPNAGSSRVLRFARSPVRIGRNELNDIPLQDPFVSEWHGIIRFDDRQIAYFDLGSTNGSVLDGKRLVKSVPAPLLETSRLKLGLLEVTVVRRPDEVTAGETTGRPEGAAASKTLSWGMSTPADGDEAAAPAPRAGDSSGGLLVHARSASGGHPQLGSGRVGGAPPKVQDATAEMGTDGPERSAAAGGPSPAMAARQAKFIEAFCEAFVGLRKGYEQFGAEVGVRTVSGTTPLHRARTGRELEEHLMQPNVDAGAVARDLFGIFADFGIHQLALMEGITEGVRAMLQALDPRANDLDAGGRLWTAAKTKSQWKAYLERFEQLVTDDEELHDAIFGDTFARAYAYVTQGVGRGKAPGGDS